MLREAGEDFGGVRRSLAFRQNDFGHTDAQRAVMIDLGEAEIFERQVSQAIDGGIGRELALAHLLEEAANGVGVHGGFAAGPPRLG